MIDTADRVVVLLADALRIVEDESDTPEMSALLHLIKCSRSAAEMIAGGTETSEIRTEVSMEARSALTCAMMLVRGAA
ncbi:hypothetical protein ASG12_20140 [Williamsia sp. Leaf354]|jgi:hypothetical protein|uniref:hypothetical protein n=1 Tax=Williamsia sp. Leaf354 TaxID=1736349 RepID=UPI0006F242FB|nr:hypothetical protein [Williamsia sp. Leaf354]KQR96453.1 hypothetical protein ASG12_20140 [Williamsia sp. Leaf354]